MISDMMIAPSQLDRSGLVRYLGFIKHIFRRSTRLNSNYIAHDLIKIFFYMLLDDQMERALFHVLFFSLV